MFHDLFSAHPYYESEHVSKKYTAVSQLTVKVPKKGVTMRCLVRHSALHSSKLERFIHLGNQSKCICMCENNEESSMTWWLTLIGILPFVGNEIFWGILWFWAIAKAKFTEWTLWQFPFLSLLSTYHMMTKTSLKQFFLCGRNFKKGGNKASCYIYIQCGIPSLIYKSRHIKLLVQHY